jgi:DNA-binding response OmpR family regulator
MACLPDGPTMSTVTPPTARSSSHILAIDDSRDDLALLADFLRGQRLRIAVAFDGNEGIQKACVIQPDLILLDIRMPRMDGYATLRLLKADQRTRDIPVIFLSGCDEVDDRVRGLTMGAVDYITKPFAPEEVLARINVHLQLRRRQQPAGTGMPAEPLLDRTVRAAMDLLLADLSHTPSLAELARQVGTNERRLTELFREATGMPVFTWLREQRVRVACEMLAGSALEIQQVAEHVGYGNASNFTTMFRDRLGVTPREYRQALQQYARAPSA